MSSHSSVNTAPSSMAPGSARWASEPIQRRAMWGTIRPTQPMSPVLETVAAVASTAASRSTRRSRPAETPSEKAVSSRRESRFNLQRKRKMMTSEGNTTGAICSTSGQVRLHRPPSSQKVISGSWRNGSAAYLSRLVPDEYSAETAMPANTRRSTQSP